jgi:hypothetical protein
LDLEDFDQSMFYYVALDSKYFANSEREWKAHKWPHALYYIALENETDELLYEKNNKKVKAYAKLESDLLNGIKKKEIV